MSITHTSRVWESSTLKGSALLVLLAIADHANDKTNICWPNVETLSTRARVGTRAVTRLIAQAEKANELYVDRAEGLSNIYIPLIGLTPFEITAAKHRIDEKRREDARRRAKHTASENHLTPVDGVKTPDPEIGTTPDPGIRGNDDTPPITRSGVPPIQRSVPPPIARSGEPEVEPEVEPELKAVAGTPAGHESSDPVSVSASTTPTKADRDAIFDAIAEHIFGVTPRTPAATAIGGRIGPLVSWCFGASFEITVDGETVTVPGCDLPVDPQYIADFAADWRRDHPDAPDPPRYREKFVQHFYPYLERRHQLATHFWEHIPERGPRDLDGWMDLAKRVKAHLNNNRPDLVPAEMRR